MGLANILRDYDTISFVDLLLLSYDSDSFTTTGSHRFQNVHVFEVVYFSVDGPSFVVLGHDVGRWTDIKSFTVETSHPLNIPPHVVFAADRP